MHKKKIAVMTMAIIISNFSATTLEVLADEVKNNSTAIEQNVIEEPNIATIKKFDLLNNKKLEEYDKSFKLDNSKIIEVTNNGKHYWQYELSKAADGDLKTHWESGTYNSDDFTNEVVFKLDEVTNLDRIVYGARQDGHKGLGFAKEFEIYTSLTNEGNDFKLVSTGSSDLSKEFVEIKFKPTDFKRIKFVFKSTNTNGLEKGLPSASEFMFYKEDPVRERMNRLYTNDKKNKLSEEFMSSQALEDLEVAAQSHPLYDDMKEDLENARILLESSKLEYVDANVSKFISVSDDVLNQYNEEFKIKRENITSITTNGGQYSTNSVDRAIDGDPNTQWHSNNKNNSSFTNEVIITLDKLTTIDRVTYLDKVSRGFAKSFDIYASKTTSGETFEKISSGSHSITTDTLEIKFKPTELRRIKLVFKETHEDWAVAYEIGLYKEDTVKDKIDRLFIDSNMSEVNAEFSTTAAIDNLIEETKGHPLENEFKEKLDIAKELLDFGKIQSDSANIKKFNAFYSGNIDAYDERFRVPNSNIEKIENNGGHYPNSQLKYAIDEDVNTHWETGNPNSSTFKNEVTLTLKEAQVINRLTYKSRNGCKGFANNFSIYISPVSSGNNFQKLSEGSYTSTNDMLEISFNPTKAKRVKFVFDKANQDWASIGDLRLYKQDETSEKMSRLFSNLVMDTVSEEFNDIKKLEELEKEVKGHPLYNLFKEDVEDAKNIVQGKIENIKTVVAEQHGDRNAHNNKNLKFGFGNNNQPTGIVARPGETITVYVDVEEGKPLPQLMFSQQEGSFANWGRTVSLYPGKNVITVPKVTQEDGWYHHSVTPGGPVYIVNPYTAEEQGKAPVIRFAKGVEEFPTIDKNTNEVEFIKFLKEYKKRIDEDIEANPDVMDRKVIDTFELVADNVVITGTVSGAYDAYVNQGFKPLDSLKMHNDHMNMLFEYQGIDGRNEKNDIKYTRENIRLAQPYGYMYAAIGHIGVQRDVMSSILTNVGGWGIDHEIGHKMDIGVRTIGEVTNNMLPQQSSYYYNKLNKRIPFESHVYKNVISTNSNKYADGELAENLAVFWQLEMIYPGYWAKLNSLYRENNVTLEEGNEYNDKLNKLAYYSSIALELDLTEYFERHGFWVSDETKEFAKRYNKPDKKIWYANYDYIEYDGEGFTTEPTIKVTTSKEGENLKLNINIDKKSKSDLMGYEIYKNDELIGFTSTNSFVDTEANFDENVVYKVVAFDKRLNESKGYETNSYAPSIKLQQNEINIKLNEEFNPSTLVRAYNYNGEEITSEIIINNGVNSSEKGIYQVEYVVTDEGITTKEMLTVNVVSDYDYLSDSQWQSVQTQWGTPSTNTNIQGKVNGTVNTFNKGISIHANGKVTYDLSGKDYDNFEALVGVNYGSIGQNNNSSITFKVIGDGKTLATTNVIKYADDMVSINVPIKGVKTLEIEVNDGGNGNTADHGLIANPKLTTNNAKPTLSVEETTLVKLNSEFNLMDGVVANDIEDGDITSKVVVSGKVNFNKSGRYPITYTVTDNDGNIVEKTRIISVVNMEDYTYLSDIKWKSANSGWRTIQKDKSIEENPLRLTDEEGNMVEYEKGIGTHSTSTIVYDLTDKDYSYFTSYVGVDREMYNSTVASLEFKVYVDGVLKYESGLMKSTDAQKYIELDINGAKELKLVATDGRDGNAADHASFGDAKLYTIKDEDADYTSLEELVLSVNEYDKYLYTFESFEVLEEVLNKANAILEDRISSQLEVNQILEELNKAIENLELDLELNNIVNIKDKYLKASIKSELKLSNDNITVGDMKKLTKLDVQGAESLDGLQYAKNLESLNIEYNEIKNLSPLKDLKKLTNLNANNQIISAGMLNKKDNKIIIDYDIINRKGEKLSPTKIIVRNNKTSQETDLNVDECLDENGIVSFNTTNFDKGIYSVYLVYEDTNDNYLAQALFMFNNI
nr:NPCBM/NEW2 domain-containing protein [uncultured Romboutsia sp.]